MYLNHTRYYQFCEHNDGLCYTSLPPKYKCLITGKFHVGIMECDLSDAEIEYYLSCHTNENETDSIDPDQLTLLNDIKPGCINTLDCTNLEPVANITGSSITHILKINPDTKEEKINQTKCIICGEYTDENPHEIITVCDECKSAIKFVKRIFRTAIEDMNDEIK